MFMKKRPCFAADIMLGKLAKWLRLMGFDTFYSNTADDDFLAALSLREKRILLTRDRPLAATPEIPAYFVQNIFLPEQLKEVTAVFHLQSFHPCRRCPVCNGKPERVQKIDVKAQIPPYIFQTKEKFSRCKNCGKVYWEGTHLQHIEEMISKTIRTKEKGTSISTGKGNE